MNELLFVLWAATSPTDVGLMEAQPLGLFETDFECSEVEADLEHENPDLHYFCADMKDSMKLAMGDPMP